MFEWAAVDQAAKYESEVADESGEVVATDANVMTASFQPATPLRGGKLSFRVRAVSGSGQTTNFSVAHAFEVFNAPIESRFRPDSQLRLGRSRG